MNDTESGVPGMMPHKDNKAVLYGVLVFVALALLVAAYWWFGVRPESVPVEGVADEEEARDSFGGEVSRRAEEPARKAGESVPDTNPLGGVETNPFGGYTNPFSR